MRILITGATGVIGKRLVPLLVGGGHQVTAVARSREKADGLARAGATPLLAPVLDADSLRAGVRGSDAVINLATSIPKSSRVMMPGAWNENSRVRREVSATLARLVRDAQVPRFIQESFAPIYADGGDQWLSEESPRRPARYNRAVIDAEEAALSLGDVGVVLRFAFFYGPDSDFFADIARMIRRGWSPTFGDPDGYISSISHDDAARAVAVALEVPGGVYNVVDDEPVTKRTFATSLAAALGAPSPRFLPRWVSRLAGSLGETLARSQRMSNSRLKSVSGWTPRYPSVVDAWPDLFGRR